MSRQLRTACLSAILAIQVGVAGAAEPDESALRDAGPLPLIGGLGSSAAVKGADFTLLVEPLSAEWEARLVPPLLRNLLSIAPYTTVRSEPPDALRRVAESKQRLALLRRSSALAAGSENEKRVELLEIGPATCVVLAVRQDSKWNGYADMNYGHNEPLRVEAVSTGAAQDFQRLRDRFAISGELTVQTRPTPIALQRLASGDADLTVLDVPRRGASDEPEDIIAFLTSKNLRLLDLPPALGGTTDGYQVGDVIVSKGWWFWESPTVYQSLCDPFVIAMPAEGADQLVYSLYSAVAANSATAKEQSGDSTAKSEPGFFDSIVDAFHRLLVAAGLASPPPVTPQL